MPFALDANTVALYHCDSAPWLADECGHYTIDTLNGHAPVTVPALQGGSAQLFDTHGYLSNPADADLRNLFTGAASEWTVEVILKSNTALTCGVMALGLQDGVNYFLFGLDLGNSGTVAAWLPDPTHDPTYVGLLAQTATGTIPRGVWRYIAVRRRFNPPGGNYFLEILVSGTLAAQNVAPTIPGAGNSQRLYIGRSIGGVDGTYMNGALDELRISNIARTDAEITAFAGAFPTSTNAATAEVPASPLSGEVGGGPRLGANTEPSWPSGGTETVIGANTVIVID
jgi:hypothetical protein